MRLCRWDELAALTLTAIHQALAAAKDPHRCRIVEAKPAANPLCPSPPACPAALQQLKPSAELDCQHLAFPDGVQHLHCTVRTRDRNKALDKAINTCGSYEPIPSLGTTCVCARPEYAMGPAGNKPCWPCGRN